MAIETVAELAARGTTRSSRPPAAQRRAGRRSTLAVEVVEAAVEIYEAEREASLPEQAVAGSSAR